MWRKKDNKRKKLGLADPEHLFVIPGAPGRITTQQLSHVLVGLSALVKLYLFAGKLLSIYLSACSIDISSSKLTAILEDKRYKSSVLLKGGFFEKPCSIAEQKDKLKEGHVSTNNIGHNLGILQRRKTTTIQMRMEAKLISFFTEARDLLCDNLR